MFEGQKRAGQFDENIMLNEIKKFKGEKRSKEFLRVSANISGMMDYIMEMLYSITPTEASWPFRHVRAAQHTVLGYLVNSGISPEDQETIAARNGLSAEKVSHRWRARLNLQ